MASIKDIKEQESMRMNEGVRDEIHFYREGTFLRAYEWSAWLACRYLHDFNTTRHHVGGLRPFLIP